MGKKSMFLIIVLQCSMIAMARQANSTGDSATITIQLHNSKNPQVTVDSVYIILDRYDRTGAGMIKQVYYPVNNSVEIAVPKGTYFVDVFCLGNYSNWHFGRVLKARQNKRNRVLLKFDECSLYTPGLVSIPVEKIDFTNLSITRPTSFK